MLQPARERTRDLLIEYNMLPVPSRAQTLNPFPRSNVDTYTFGQQLYELACLSGYTGTKEQFLNNFGLFLNNQRILFDILSNFPIPGQEGYLYYDIETNILYAWKNNEYIPINTMLIADTILNGGEA